MAKFKSYEAIAEENNLEVFHCPTDYPLCYVDGWEEEYPEGWYWWSCSPGCLPDGDPIGPFDTEEEALHDAVEPFLY